LRGTAQKILFPTGSAVSKYQNPAAPAPEKLNAPPFRGMRLAEESLLLSFFINREGFLSRRGD
jgi:hypothetical protein